MPEMFNAVQARETGDIALRAGHIDPLQPFSPNIYTASVFLGGAAHMMTDSTLLLPITLLSVLGANVLRGAWRTWKSSDPDYRNMVYLEDGLGVPAPEGMKDELKALRKSLQPGETIQFDPYTMMLSSAPEDTKLVAELRYGDKSISLYDMS